MRIELTGRNLDITPALRAHVSQKLEQAVGELGDIAAAHVVLTVQKYRHIAEIAIKRRRGSLTGEAWSRDMYRSIQKAIDRLETQLRRKRQKRLRQKRRPGTKPSEPQQPPARPVARKASVTAKPRPSDLAQVIEERIDRVKPIAVEEAILLLESSRRPFVMFRSSVSDRVAVVYRRQDGRYGLVEPKS